MKPLTGRAARWAADRELEPVVVLAVCTDRGEHAPTKIARFEVRDRGDEWNAKLAPAVPAADDHTGVDRVRYDFDGRRRVVELCCPRCRRTPRRPLNEWAQAAVALATRGATEFDLSIL